MYGCIFKFNSIKKYYNSTLKNFLLFQESCEEVTKVQTKAAELSAVDQ